MATDKIAAGLDETCHKNSLTELMAMACGETPNLLPSSVAGRFNALKKMGSPGFQDAHDAEVAEVVQLLTSAKTEKENQANSAFEVSLETVFDAFAIKIEASRPPEHKHGETKSKIRDSRSTLRDSSSLGFDAYGLDGEGERWDNLHTNRLHCGFFARGCLFGSIYLDFNGAAAVG